MLKLLFISHESSRTGAPLVLLYLLKWLKKHRKRIQISLITIRGGSLNDEFKLVVDDFYEYDKFNYSILNWKVKLRQKILLKTGIIKNTSPKEKLFQHLAKQKFDLIYANTVESIPIAKEIKDLDKKTKIVVHVHELESEIRRTIKSLSIYRNEVDLWIAASSLVKTNLETREEIDREKITVVYSFTKNLINYKEVKAEEKKVFLVGGSGKFSFRKGGDVFVRTAYYINQNYPHLSIKFLWVGAITENDRVFLEKDLKKLKLHNIEFVDEVQNPEDYFSQFDVFLLTSREDPFPLVGVEAGMLGVPIICFEDSTGLSEIILEKGGFVVPYLDIKEMAEKILLYYKDSTILSRHAAYNKKIFSTFTAAEKVPEIYELLKGLIKK